MNVDDFMFGLHMGVILGGLVAVITLVIIDKFDKPDK